MLPLLYRSFQNLVLKTNGHLCMQWPRRGWRFLFTKLELCRGSFPPAFGSWGTAEPQMHRASSTINPEPTGWFIPHKLPGEGTCGGGALCSPQGSGVCIQTPCLDAEEHGDVYLEQKTAHCNSKLSRVSQLCTGMLGCLQTNCTRLFATLIQCLSHGYCEPLGHICHRSV